jgi:Putative Actinobacterial Holin-X, holin superfamily III
MADQSSLNGHATARVPGSSSAQFDGVAEFVDDLASLAELQAKLAAADFKEAARKSALPIVLTVLGLTTVVASALAALLGAGWLLASAFKIHQGWAMLLTAGAAMALGGLAAALGSWQLIHSFDSFRRLRQQLWLNLAWIRNVLVTSSRPHVRRRS